jgi:hypothetical protein
MDTELPLYRSLLADVKTRVRQAQHKAVLSANAEMIRLYWDIGRLMAARQELEGWGAGVIPRLAADLKNELPEEKGFSERNIKRMLRFYHEYSVLPAQVPQVVALVQSAENQDPARVPQPVALLDANAASSEILQQTAAKTPAIFFLPIVQRSVAQLGWGHNVILFEKIKHLTESEADPLDALIRAARAIRGLRDVRFAAEGQR